MKNWDEKQVEGPRGLVVEYKGKYWGEQYADGHSTCNGWGPIEKARVSNPQFCHKTTDITWTPTENRSNPDYDELKKGRFFYVTSRTTFMISVPAPAAGPAKPEPESP